MKKYIVTKSTPEESPLVQCLEAENLEKLFIRLIKRDKDLEWLGKINTLDEKEFIETFSDWNTDNFKENVIAWYTIHELTDIYTLIELL